MLCNSIISCNPSPNLHYLIHHLLCGSMIIRGHVEDNIRAVESKKHGWKGQNKKKILILKNLVLYGLENGFHASSDN